LSRTNSEKLTVALFWLLVLCLCFVSPNRGVWTPDEPREAEIGREMLLHPGFTPHLNEKPFFEKPPLYYWALSAAYAIAGGPSPAAARALSGLMAFLTLLAAYFWARRSASEHVAHMAVFMLATSVQFFQCAHWVLMDPMLMLFLTLASWAGFEQAVKPRLSVLVAFYGCVTLAVWTKGLVGLALPLAGLLPYFALDRKARSYRVFRPLLSGAAIVLVAALCVGAFYLAEGREAVYQFLWVNQVLRFVHPVGTGHAQPFYYYIEMSPLVVLPWLAPFAGLFARSFWRGRGEGERPELRRYLICIVLGGFVLLSLASTKRSIYLLPLLPPLFILLASSLNDALQPAESEAPLWKKLLFGRFHPAILAVWGVALPLAVLVYTRSPWPTTVNLLALGLLAGGFGIWWGFKDLAKRAWELQRLSAMVLCVAALGLAVPVLDAQKDMAPFVRWIDQELPRGVPVPAIGSDETLCGIIPFVTGRDVVELKPDGLQGLLDGPGAPAYLVEQLGSGARDQNLAGHGYALAGERQFGVGRKIRLWKRP